MGGMASVAAPTPSVLTKVRLLIINVSFLLPNVVNHPPRPRNGLRSGGFYCSAFFGSSSVLSVSFMQDFKMTSVNPFCIFRFLKDLKNREETDVNTEYITLFSILSSNYLFAESISGRKYSCYRSKVGFGTQSDMSFLQIARQNSSESVRWSVNSGFESCISKNSSELQIPQDMLPSLQELHDTRVLFMFWILIMAPWPAPIFHTSSYESIPHSLVFLS
jgi:hypothetical protein